MKKRKDWIPKAQSLFRKFADNFCLLISTNAIAWKLVPAQVTALLALQTKYNNYDDVSSNVKYRTKLDTQNTEDALPGYVKAIRVMGIGSLKFNGSMTNTDRSNCGVVNNSTTKTQAAVANVGPGIGINTLGSLNVKISILPPTVGAMPTGQKGITIKFGFYAVGSPVPTEAQCMLTVLISKKFSVVVFDVANEGLLYVGYARYVNTRDQIGTAATIIKGAVN